MGLEPPPDVRRADRMRREGIRGRIRTGAKTATKDQERDYLDRFARLAEDPSVLVPRWAGDGGDPFAKLKRQLEKVHRRRDSDFWLKWHGRGKDLAAAYAQTLLALRAGKIPSFASLKFRGRDVRYVMRGRGLRDKLIAVQNHDEPDVRLLGYTDLVRKHRVVLVSLPGQFLAGPAGRPPEASTLESILRDLELEPVRRGDAYACPHASGRSVRVDYELKDLDVRLSLCRACVESVDGFLDPALEAYVLGPGGRLDISRTITGSDLAPHPETAQRDLDALVAAAAQDAKDKSKGYVDVHDTDLLRWTEEAFVGRLEARAEGYLLVGDRLWLGDFEAAAHAYGSDETERLAIAAAFRAQPPRLRTSDATVNRLLEAAWPSEAVAVLRAAGGDILETRDLEELARQRPGDALASLGRLQATEKRFAGFPRFTDLAPPLRLAHDLFKAHRTGNTGLLQRRLAEGVKDPHLKPLALALARGFGQSAGIEWQYAPHEKDQALFWEPFAHDLAAATPDTYLHVLARLADAANAPKPVPAAAPS